MISDGSGSASRLSPDLEVSVQASRQFQAASIFVRKPDGDKLALFTVDPAGICRLSVVSEGSGADLERLWPPPPEAYIREALLLIYYGGITA